MSMYILKNRIKCDFLPCKLPKQPRLSGFLWSKDPLDHKIHQSDRLIDTGVAGEAVGMVIRFAESVVVRGKTRISAEKRINIERTVSIGNNSH